MPEGRYTLRVLVKDVLDPATGDAAAPRSASRSLDFVVGAPGRRTGLTTDPSAQLFFKKKKTS